MIREEEKRYADKIDGVERGEIIDGELGRDLERRGWIQYSPGSKV